MGDNVLVNADRTAVVEETDPGKKFQMRRKDAIRLGLLPDGERVPQARRQAREDTVRTVSATVPETVEPAKAATRRRRTARK